MLRLVIKVYSFHRERYEWNYRRLIGGDSSCVLIFPFTRKTLRIMTSSKWFQCPIWDFIIDTSWHYRASINNSPFVLKSRHCTYFDLIFMFIIFYNWFYIHFWFSANRQLIIIINWSVSTIKLSKKKKLCSHDWKVKC